MSDGPFEARRLDRHLSNKPHCSVVMSDGPFEAMLPLTNSRSPLGFCSVVMSDGPFEAGALRLPLRSACALLFRRDERRPL